MKDRSTKVNGFSGYIKRGHWEGDVYVIEEFELESVSIKKPKQFERWRDKTYGGRRASKVIATQDAIMAYYNGMPLDEFLRWERQSQGEGGGDSGNTSVAPESDGGNSHRDGAL